MDALILVAIAVGLLILLSLPSFVWVMVISGLIQFTQETEQENSTRQPKSTSMLAKQTAEFSTVFPTGEWCSPKPSA